MSINSWPVSFKRPNLSENLNTRIWFVRSNSSVIAALSIYPRPNLKSEMKLEMIRFWAFANEIELDFWLTQHVESIIRCATNRPRRECKEQAHAGAGFEMELERTSLKSRPATDGNKRRKHNARSGTNARRVFQYAKLEAQTAMKSLRMRRWH